MARTLKELRAKFPDCSAADLGKALEIINRKPMAIHEIWRAENNVSETPQLTDSDGLTKPMRELNRFAAERALAIPFPVLRRLFHQTTEKAASSILVTGFRDGERQSLAAQTFKGVRLLDRRLNSNEGAIGKTLLSVELALSPWEWNELEWIEELRPYREWFIPADLLNAHAKSLRIVGDGESSSHFL